MNTYRYVILGAGAAGLSLCHALLKRGVTDPILILDSKEAFTDDRTWCFWDDGTNPFRDLVSHCWHSWEVFDETGRAAFQESPAAGYACLRGLDFYREAQSQIARHANVTLALGVSVEDCESFPDHALVKAGGCSYEADYVFDSRLRLLPESDAPAFTQRFFGQFIRAESPVFDPSRCTLMDFRAPQEHGLHFFYLLPFSPTTALIENTYLLDRQTAAVASELHRTEIRSYLAQQRGLDRYSVLREESGAIPMTTYPFARRAGRIFFIGTAGGCTKPSSGYTFLRILEQCRQIAAAAASEHLDRFRERLAPARYRFFDAVFLEALRDRPAAFPGCFHRLFSRVPPEALTAFLSETSTWRSDIQIMKSLPLDPFLRAALSTILRRHGSRPPRACASG